MKDSLITSFPMTNSKWVTLNIFVEGCFITPFSMANSLWVTLHTLWKAVSSYSFLWPTASEQYCTFYERQSHHILSYDQQSVSDIAHSVNGSLITSYNQQWVSNKLHILWKTVSSHLFLWPIASEWHWRYFWRQSHHTFFYDQQSVSDIAHFAKGSLITSFPMSNSKWAMLQILWKTASLHLALLPTACEKLHCTFCERQSDHIVSYDQ